MGAPEPRRSRRIALIVAFVALGLASLRAEPPLTASPNELKAAFIYNFAKFVEWPADAMSPTAFTIDVIEDDALATALRRMVEGKRVQGRPIAVHSDSRAHDTVDGQIVVIGQTEDGAIGWELDRLKHRPILTVGDSPRFLQLGGIIRFRQIDNRLRFDIKQEAAVRAGLRLSARLLVLARGEEGRP